MKLHLLAATTVLLTLAGAAAVPDKQVIITYPKDTPDSVLQQAKDAIKAANLSSMSCPSGSNFDDVLKTANRGFAATASAKALDVVNTLSTDFIATIEEDQIVTINQPS
ncbi:MAG: hypothetical protein Q9187_003223 [Circinaria calcarea]